MIHPLISSYFNSFISSTDNPVSIMDDLDDKYDSVEEFLIHEMIDKEGLLDYKDAPIDKGKNIFLNLYRKRFSI